MKCFLNLKGILIKSRGHKSAPELKQQSKTDNSGSPVIPKSSAASSPRSLPDLNGEKAPNLRVFAFSDLRNATDNFSRFFKIGEGGFGCVYKGMIKAVDGQGGRIVVAIKKLNKDGFQGHKQWLAEVCLLGFVEHPNLVKLIGYCAVDGERGMQRLLVYEYVPNKSLEDHLFHQVCPALSWQKRLEILLGAALGLAYLHEEVQVIYRDFKASNVLLDNDFMPKLSDFGLAREGPEAGQTHVSTAICSGYFRSEDY